LVGGPRAEDPRADDRYIKGFRRRHNLSTDYTDYTDSKHRIELFDVLNAHSMQIVTLNRRTGSGSDLADSTDSTGVSGLLNIERC
jgi:hypothetical protein